MPTLREYDQAQFHRITGAQFGVISREQALACGITPAMIDYRLRLDGPWRRLLTGVYIVTTGTPTTMQRAMAALLYAGPLSMITGPAALEVYGLDSGDPDIIDVLIPANHERTSMGFVRITRTRRMPASHSRVGPLRYVPAARAVGDAARSGKQFGDVQALVCRAVQKKKCTPDELSAEAHEGPAKGSRLFREAVGEVTSGIWSSPEADLMKLVRQSGIEEPVYNPMLYAADGTFLGCPDAWWSRAGVAAEVDSRQYHLEAADQERTSKKHNKMTAAGINVLHWQPKTIRTEPRTVVSDLKDALKVGVSRPKLPIRTVRTTAAAA